MADLLSDILMRLSVKGTLYFRTSFTPPWGVAVPAYENVARFHFAHRGEAMVQLPETGEKILIAQGDLVIIPHGAAHNLSCGRHKDGEILPLDLVLEKSGYKGEGALVFGGDDPAHETQLICGHFDFARLASHPIFEQLPGVIHIPNYGASAGSWLEATLKVIGNEAGAGQMGSDLIALKMSEAIFAQAIRAYILQPGQGLRALAGLSDPQIYRALEALHNSPAENWTVERLAQIAGQSRTGFAQSFTNKMGVTPMQYVTSWRMQIARQALVQEQANLADAADLAGYASLSSFSRVFKKEFGLTPAEARRLH